MASPEAPAAAAAAATPATAATATAATACNHEGYLDKESKSSKWNRRYFVLETTCLRYYKDKPERLPEEERQSRGEIRLKRVVSVAATTAKEHRSCLEIQTASGPIYLAAYSDQDRQQWIESIRLACKRITSVSSTSDATGPMSALSIDDPGIPSQGGAAKSDTFGTRTAVVGGVVVRIPMKSEGDASSAPAERTSEADSHPDRVMSVGSTPANSAPIGQQLTSAGSGTVASGHRRLGGRVAKSGHCVKQGHVRKNWKKRFFLVDPFGFAYYQNESDKEPIKNIPIQDILAVSECGSYGSKQHVFQVATNGSIYYVQAPDETEMNQWVEAIRGQLHVAVSSSSDKSTRRSMKY